jgi:uncharacterized protein
MLKFAKFQQVYQRIRRGSLKFLTDGFASTVKKTVRGNLAKILWISLLCLSQIGFPLLSHALTVNDIPNPRQEYNGWVTDMANILSDRTESELNLMISELEAKNGTEIAVVTVSTTAPSPSPKAFTTEIFNHWGIGKKGVDNGVLFLTSVGDRRVEIETGYGIEGVLPDAQVGNIISSQITPRFRQGDWDGGVLAGTEALVNILSQNTLTSSPAENETPRGLLSGASGVALGLFLLAYKKARKMILEPIQLHPKWGSQVLGNERKNIKPGLYTWIYLGVLSFVYGAMFVTNAIDPSLDLWRWFVMLSIGLFALTLLSDIWRGMYGRAEDRMATKILSVILFSFIGIIVGTFLSVIGILIWSLLSFTAGFAPMLPVNLIVAFGMSLLLIYVVDRLLVLVFKLKPIFQCNLCDTTLVLVPENILNQELTDPQKAAQKLGSKRFEGWHCSHCYPDNLSKFHLREYILNNSRFSECPYCQELTVVRKEEIIKQPSYSDTGIRQITYRCQCCDYLQEQQEVIPLLVHTYINSNSNYDSGSGGGFGGGDSGGGGFGGGDSGGGGAGGDF